MWLEKAQCESVQPSTGAQGEGNAKVSLKRNPRKNIWRHIVGVLLFRLGILGGLIFLFSSNLTCL